MRKGSKEAKAWGRKMQRLRSGKVYKSSSANSSMVKRRRAKSHSKRRSGGSSNFGKTVLMGGAGYLAYKMFLAPKLNLGTATPILELGAGYYLSKKGGFIGDIGKVAFVVSAVSLMNQYLVPMINSTGITATQSSGGAFY